MESDLMHTLTDHNMPIWGIHHLNRAQKHAHGILPWHALGYTGKGVKIAITDNQLAIGIEFLHGSVKTPLSYNVGGPYPRSIPDSHGQRVAQTVIEYAPGAEVSCLPYWNYGDETAYTRVALERSIRWAAENGIQILNASIGGSSRADVRDAADFALDHGVLLITSAGNTGISGFDEKNPKKTATTTALGSDSRWISVANLVWDDYPAESGVIRKAGSSALGPNITTACFGGYRFPRILNGGAALPATGTSYASPTLAGLLACYYQRYRERHDKWPSHSHIRKLISEQSRILDNWKDRWTYAGGKKSYAYGSGIFRMPSFR